AAGLAALKSLNRDNGAIYQHLKTLAQRLKENFAADIVPLFAGRDWQISLVQDESLFWLSFQKAGTPVFVRSIAAVEGFGAKIYARIFHEMLARGIYLAPSAYEVGFLNAAMRNRDIDFFTAALKKILKTLPDRLKDF
ncbi:MAG: aspartate aminotransferase family protein, partial [Spirochaetes bacterium]|nr:aspartate aminotransferase family protein [Spirochaetota bacterium]